MTDNNEQNRNFSDEDLQALIEIFWHKIQREIGKSILSAVGGTIVTAVIAAVAFVLAIKFKFLGVSVQTP